MRLAGKATDEMRHYLHAKYFEPKDSAEECGQRRVGDRREPFFGVPSDISRCPLDGPLLAPDHSEARDGVHPGRSSMLPTRRCQGSRMRAAARENSPLAQLHRAR